jgi:hypothetical protein
MRLIITGTTGMIGEGILLEMLENKDIESVLSVSRRGCGVQHPKLEEYVVPSFLDLKQDDIRLNNYDACFFCAGVSSVGKSEKEYTLLTYDTTMAFARAVGSKSKCTFVYVSGSGTDSTEKGSLMWARVKGKTENDLLKMDFKAVFAYRIGAVVPVKLQKYVQPYYKYLSWLIPIWKKLAPNSICSMKDLGRSFLYVSQKGYEKNVIHVKDIRKMIQL